MHFGHVACRRLSNLPGGRLLFYGHGTSAYKYAKQVPVQCWVCIHGTYHAYIHLEVPTHPMLARLAMRHCMRQQIRKELPGNTLTALIKAVEVTYNETPPMHALQSMKLSSQHQRCLGLPHQADRVLLNRLGPTSNLVQGFVAMP